MCRAPKATVLWGREHLIASKATEQYPGLRKCIFLLAWRAGNEPAPPCRRRNKSTRAGGGAELAHRDALHICPAAERARKLQLKCISSS